MAPVSGACVMGINLIDYDRSCIHLLHKTAGNARHFGPRRCTYIELSLFNISNNLDIGPSNSELPGRKTEYYEIV